MLKYSLILLAVLSTACGAPPEEQEQPSQQQLAPPPPVTLGDIFYCNFINASGMAWSHKIHRYSDGSTFASCEIADGYESFSSVSLYKASQAGAATGYCSITVDWDTSPTNGWWKFEYNGTTSKATYSDPGSTFNGLVQTLSCTKF